MIPLIVVFEFPQEVGEESKLARSIERVRSLIRAKRQAKKDKKAIKETKLEEVVREAQIYHLRQKEIILAETKLHRLSYQESMNRPVSVSDFGFDIPLKEGLQTIVDHGEYEEEFTVINEKSCNDDNNLK